MGGWLSLLFTPASKIVRIKHRKYIIEKQIGEGGFSFVYLVRDPWTKEKFAVKKTLCQTEELIAASNKEIQILRDYKHPNLIHLIDYEITRTPTGQQTLILMPYYMRGTVQSIIDSRRQQTFKQIFFSEFEIVSMLYGAAKGVAEFHKQNPPLSHNDIKPGNMLISDDNQVLLFDFGSVNIARHDINSKREAIALQEWADSNCTPMYKAPELFDVSSDASIDEKTDIWSLGCTLYAMCFNKSPFETAAVSGSVALAVLSGKIEIPEDASNRLSKELLDLMMSMLDVDHTQRPYIEVVIEKCAKILPPGKDLKINIK